MTRRRKKKAKPITLYVLELKWGKFYVGQSTVPNRRIKKHFDGNGSAWTKLYPPVKVIKKMQLNTSSRRKAFDMERDLTLTMMKLFGWENVRGAGWSNIEINTAPLELN